MELDKAPHGIDVETVLLGSTLVDSEGNSWAVPALTTLAFDEMNACGPLWYPEHLRNPDFNYEWVKNRERTFYEHSYGARTCTRREFEERGAGLTQETEQRRRSEENIGPSVSEPALMVFDDGLEGVRLMKWPKVVRDRTLLGNHMRAVEVLKSTEPQAGILQPDSAAMNRRGTAAFGTKSDEGPVEVVTAKRARVRA